MAGYRADAVAESLDIAMNAVRDAMTAIPTRFKKFRGKHKDMADAISRLSVAISDNRLNFSGETPAKARAVTKRTTRAVKAVK